MKYALQTTQTRTRIWYFIVTIFSVSALPAFAQSNDIRDQLNVTTGKAELVVPGMDPNEVAAKMKEAISQFSIPSNLNFRSLPSEIPERPDQPEAKQRFIRGASVVEYQCPTAFAEITKTPPPVSNAFVFVAEQLQICLYSFQKGTKAYLIFNRAKKTESLTAGLFNGITSAIQGTDGERITKQLQESISDIKKEIPSVLVERFEVPGMPLQQPDKAAVAALIPAKMVVQQQQTKSTTTGDAVPAAAPAPTNSLQAKIEARKSLTAMGMTYHSQEQFFAAVRRKDDVAVQLFLDADNINLASKDASGRTPLEVANDVGAADVAALIKARIDRKTTPAVNPVQTAKAEATSPLAANSESVISKVGDVTARQLPPEMLAELNQRIDGLDVPAEQKEILRANAIRQVLAIRSLTSRIDPNTGMLK